MQAPNMGGRRTFGHNIQRQIRQTKRQTVDQAIPQRSSPIGDQQIHADREWRDQRGLFGEKGQRKQQRRPIRPASAPPTCHQQARRSEHQRQHIRLDPRSPQLRGRKGKHPQRRDQTQPPETPMNTNENCDHQRHANKCKERNCAPSSERTRLVETETRQHHRVQWRVWR